MLDFIRGGFAFVFFLPHILLLFFSKNRKFILHEFPRKRSDYFQIIQVYLDVAEELLKNPCYRVYFHHKIQNNFSKLLKFVYPIESTFIIDVKTTIEPGIRLVHPFSTIINAIKIGENFYVNHSVTIGEKNGKKPSIGKNVQVHAGAIIIGGITIGDNAIIGAGAVVVNDVPANATVVGNPARII